MTTLPTKPVNPGLTIAQMNQRNRAAYSKDAANGFEESKHPRASNGEFGSGGGGEKKAAPEKTKTSAKVVKEKIAGMTKEKLHASLKNPEVDPAIKKLIERELDDRANRGS